ncbi:FAD dependent oxidoreductase [compost metagenome]
MLDIDEEAFGGVRVMVNMNQLGEAVGVAAYIALTEEKGFANVDVQSLRHRLQSGGSIVL